MKISWVNTVYEVMIDDGCCYHRFGQHANFEWCKMKYDGECIEITKEDGVELEKQFQEYMQNAKKLMAS